MARRSRRPKQRVTTVTTRPHRESRSFTSRRLVRQSRPSRRLAVIEDRRLYHPDRFTRPARSFTNRTHRLAVDQPRRVSEPPGLHGRAKKRRRRALSFARIKFEDPKTLICVRRRRRREVLFAKGVGGGRVSRRRRTNEFSSISCRKGR